MPIIEDLKAREILDSRGRPTVLVSCKLRSGATESASVPSGASTGASEALELRDGDPNRYSGLGCLRAVENVNSVIRNHVAGREFSSQNELDDDLCRLDGTADKSRLGANGVLAVSLAFAKAYAIELNVPLYSYFAALVSCSSPVLPRLSINLFSGGKHAGGQVAIQDVLIVPLHEETIDKVLSTSHRIYETAAALILQRYGMRRLRADEGGLAPPVRTSREMIELAVEAIQQSGFSPGADIALAVDVASTHFYKGGQYHLDGEILDAKQMVSRISSWIDSYPIISVEDGLAEEAWEDWPMLRKTIAGRSMVLGDDLLCTNPIRIQRAREQGACDALLLKVNQVGTLSEAAVALKLARSAGWAVVVSVRSGETEDTWAADLAVGWGADLFKNGSITQSERTAKLNRLLAISEETKWPVRPMPLINNQLVHIPKRSRTDRSTI